MTAILPSWLRVVEGGVSVAVAAQPGARKSEIVGTHGDALKIKIASPPVDGAANEALLAFLAKRLGRRMRDLRLLKGPASRKKVVEIKGVTAGEAIALLNPPLG